MSIDNSTKANSVRNQNETQNVFSTEFALVLSNGKKPFFFSKNVYFDNYGDSILQQRNFENIFKTLVFKRKQIEFTSEFLMSSILRRRIYYIGSKN